MQNTIINNKTKIENLIYEIRGKHVMLDSDVSKLFGYMTKDLNRNVKNNIERFPENYCFRLKEEEYNSLRCNFFTLKNGRGEHRKYLPYAFTEYGIVMLAGILRSEIAVSASLKIVDAFINMRKFINDNKDMFKRLTITKYKILELDDKLNELFDKLEPKKLENQKIFFNGEIYDSYSLIIELIREVNDRIIVIDNYIDKSILDMLAYKKEKAEVTLITSSHYLTKLDISKFNQQYQNLTIKYSNIFHDRFIIIDNALYHVGSSLKDLGKKCFGINKIEDNEYLERILSSID